MTLLLIQGISIFATNHHSRTPTVIPAKAGIQKSLWSSVAQSPSSGKTNKLSENRKTLASKSCSVGSRRVRGL